jgi:hypothetical protein
VKAYRGTSSKNDEAGGGKAVKDAPERVFRHALVAGQLVDGPCSRCIISDIQRKSHTVVEVF